MVDRRARLILAVTLVLAAGSCAVAASKDSDSASAAPGRPPTATVLFAGDAMLGRRIAPIAAADPNGIFADVRREIRQADIAAVNVESPLTTLPHGSPNPYTLEADPTTALLLANAGFDVAGLANNHAGDAGPESVVDTIEAIEAAGMTALGGGDDSEAAWQPVVVDVRGIGIAMLAIDVSGQGLRAGERSPGVASWDPETAEQAVREALSLADVVTVGIHGGVEYWTRADPLLTPIAHQLAGWGVDVVWGHGPHVEQSVTVVDPDGDGRPTLIATSLGNFLFDQQTPETSSGLILEVLVNGDGLIAHRIGDKHHDDLRVHFAGWRTPVGDAALIRGNWWNLDRVVPGVNDSYELPAFGEGIVIDAAASDLDGDDHDEVLVSYRHPVRMASGESSLPPADRDGMSAHIGVFETDGTPIWMSRLPPHPVGDVAACDGSAAFAFTGLNDDAVVAIGAGVWSGFGFVLDAKLPGTGDIGCFDIDGDGLLDPVVTDRRSP